MMRIMVVCLVAIALCVWLISRWDAWFGNPDETAYVPSNEPSRILLTFGTIDGLTRNVSWSCGQKVQPAYVEMRDGNRRWQVTAEGEVFRSRSGVATYYVARLRGLQPGHHYCYRVCTGGHLSPWYSFRVQEAEKSSTSFIYMGDIQDTLFGIANHLLKEAFRHNPDAEFLVCGGDLTERPTDTYWRETFATLDSVGQAVPVLTITGNHDYLKGVICTLERRFSLIHSYFLDSKEDDNHVFTVRYGNLQIFALDSNREFFFLMNQHSWLERQLEESNAKWKILLIHHPLYSIKGCMNNLIQQWMFDSLVREHGVDLVLQGHEHAYARMTNHDAHDVPAPPVYTVSHCSPKNYRIQFDELFDKFGSGSRYYQKVRTSGDTMFITAVDACTQTLYDSLFIVKKGDASHIVDEGKGIPERIEFTPISGSKRDAAFAKRIADYKAKHPDRQ